MIDKEKHNTYVMQILHEFAPGATIYVCPWNFSKKEIEAYVRSKPPGFFDLANVSISSPNSDAYNFLLDLGIVTTCSSGNDGDQDDNGVDFPANLPWTVAVGAEGKSYSNGGKMLNCVAPTDITVQRGNGQKFKYTGTSSSNPVTNALLARYVCWGKESGQPRLLPYDSVKLVNQMSIDIEEEGFDYASGYGLFCLPKEIPKVEEVPSMSTPYNRTIQAIVIHHMGDGLPPEVSILKRWNPYNYDYPEYDYGIEADGTLRIGRPLDVQGSHTISDKAPYSQKGYNWWNRNAIGIGLAGDFTLYPMPKAQFDALVGLVRSLMAEHKLTLDNVYPHGQVAYTDCPGCTYSKVPVLTNGLWSYDEFEQAVLEPEKEEEDEEAMDHAVIYFTDTDFSSARIVSRKLGGCAMYCRDGNNANVHKDIEKCKHPVVVGGEELNISGVTNCCGLHAEDTAIKAAQYAQTL
ncbi:N-acetylmuramoyl-L-alanine amidase [Desulfosporosinus nitroreducens]|uniref:N-acetylmuramoyl-L-alanine amidase n=1 Tax=Desulfosporosinus nitroreducens TaxID=2018668 RepID=UPI00207C9C15|nr:N-acetylmuramoyl-L-alanine amidase [Desulfosporosinus nitroreducens]MCO1599805.1 N-acetylmuramoyl-L-alanine amidase [Desulfosporosinus nitroreducens]